MTHLKIGADAKDLHKSAKEEIYQKMPTKTFDLEQLLRDHEKAFGIFITVHDELGQLRGRENRNPLSGRHLHMHPYCRYLRDKREGELLCTQNCVSRINQIFNSSPERSECSEKCWKGIHEVVVTIRMDGIRMLTLFAGTFRGEGEVCPLAEEEARHFYAALPILTAAKEEELSRVLYALGVSLLALLEQELRAEIPACLSTRRRHIEYFIRRNAHRPDCSLKELARELYLSVSRTGHMVREECGENFRVLLNLERIGRAKRLLLTSDLLLDQVAERTGFESGSYFSRIFRQYEKISPGQYRQKSWNQIPRC